MLEAGIIKMAVEVAAKEVAKEVTKEVGKMAASEVEKLPEKMGSVSEVKDLADKIGQIKEKALEQKILEQEKSIAEVESGNRSLETNVEKGNYGEMKIDQDLREKGYKRISKDMVTNIDQKGRQGIDGVYYNPKGEPQYIIVDAKYGTAQLGDTVEDGKQMCQEWIDKRLDASVGKEMADKIRIEQLMNPDNVGTYEARVDEFGNVTYNRLDSKANVIEKGVSVGA